MERKSEPVSKRVTFWKKRPCFAMPGLSPGRGRGLIAVCDIPEGALIDRSPTVEVLASQSQMLDEMRPLGDYYFEHPSDPRAGLMAFGLMSMLNHADQSNADILWWHDEDLGWFADLVACTQIRAGEEVTYRYKAALWFAKS